MDYPFQIGIDDNQTQAEKDHITEFVTGEFAPLSEHTYKGKDGKERICDGVFLPRGCKVPQNAKLPPTVYHQAKEKTYYRTPFATKEDQILARVTYTENGKYYTCNSKEWLEFCRGGSSKHTPKAGAPPHPHKSGAMAMAGKMAEGKTDISEGAEWQKVKQRETSKKKSSKKSS